jgi:Lrp/AsnC family leucine-responsive transcriptional regulator
MYQPDETDLKILKALQEDGRLTTKELAAKVNLSATPVYERVRKLEKEGFIKKYVAILDYEKLHRGFGVFCNIKLKQINSTIANDFVNFVAQIPELPSATIFRESMIICLKFRLPT